MQSLPCRKLTNINTSPSSQRGQPCRQDYMQHLGVLMMYMYAVSLQLMMVNLAFVKRNFKMRHIAVFFLFQTATELLKALASIFFSQTKNHCKLSRSLRQISFTLALGRGL